MVTIGHAGSLKGPTTESFMEKNEVYFTDFTNCISHLNQNTNQTWKRKQVKKKPNSSTDCLLVVTGTLHVLTTMTVKFLLLTSRSPLMVSLPNLFLAMQ